MSERLDSLTGQSVGVTIVIVDKYRPARGRHIS